MTEVGIKCTATSLGNLPHFIIYFYDPYLNFLILCLLYCKIIMAGKLTHTTSGCQTYHNVSLYSQALAFSQVPSWIAFNKML